MKSIYILLTKTHTVPSRLIHLFKGGRFTHSSIALVPSTQCFYSFARRSIHNPFTGGFIVEDLNQGIFRIHRKCQCALYKIELSDDAYNSIKNYIIENYVNQYKRSKYNYLGFFTLALGISFKRKYKRTCSQFVALALENSNEVVLPKDPFLMLPNDFLKLSSIKKIYEGSIENCSFNSSALHPLQITLN